MAAKIKNGWGGRRPGAGRRRGPEKVRLTVALSPDVAARLTAEAARRGGGAAGVAAMLIEAALPPAVAEKPTAMLTWADL